MRRLIESLTPDNRRFYWRWVAGVFGLYVALLVQPIQHLGHAITQSVEIVRRVQNRAQNNQPKCQPINHRQPAPAFSCRSGSAPREHPSAAEGDEGVGGLLDEACIALIFVFACPDGTQQRCQARLAGRVLFSTGQSLKHSRYRPQVLFLASANQIRLAERDYWPEQCR